MQKFQHDTFKFAARAIAWKALMIALFLCAVAGSANANERPWSTTTNGDPGVYACLTEEYWDEFGSALARKDEHGAKYLLDSNKCLLPKAGLKVSILDGVGFFAGLGTKPVKVRVYLGDSALVLYMALRGLTGWESPK